MDNDPVLSPDAHRWAPYVLIGLVLFAMALANLGDCAPLDRATPKPPPRAEVGPWRMPIPDDTTERVTPAGGVECTGSDDGDARAGSRAAAPCARSDLADAGSETGAAPRDRSSALPSASESRPTAGDVLRLARICASEAGLRITPDCAAIHAVLIDRARRMGISYRRAACAYSTRTCTRSRDDERAWIAHLRSDGRRPERWPAQASWRRQRGAWLSLLEHAGHVLRGDVAADCAPHHWGMPRGIDLRRARLAGWTRIDCGETRNAFWRVPRFSD